MLSVMACGPGVAVLVGPNMTAMLTVFSPPSTCARLNDSRLTSQTPAWTPGAPVSHETAKVIVARRVVSPVIRRTSVKIAASSNGSCPKSSAIEPSAWTLATATGGTVDPG